MGFWKAITARGARWADAATRLGSFDVEQKVDAPADAVWQILIDTQTWCEWGPSVVEVDSDERFLGPNAVGSVRTAARVWMDFEITHWDDGHRWVWDVEGVRATGHRVEPTDDGGCVLVFEVPTVAAPYAAVCKRAARKISEMAMRQNKADDST